MATAENNKVTKQDDLEKLAAILQGKHNISEIKEIAEIIRRIAG